MKSIKDVFAIYKQGLGELYDLKEIEAITLMVISEICNLSKAKIKAFPEIEVPHQQAEKLTAILNELKTGKPLQYILGTSEFYGLTFKVNSSVLIPRPETEELVEWVIGSVGSEQFAVSGEPLAIDSILDIGTGSGCIAISLKKNLPNLVVSAIDISSDALTIARQNADLNKVDINFIEADILKLSESSSQISIIVSNPPYVTLHDKTQMHTNVTDFEPHTALFVPEDDPLLFYRAIADFALQHLKSSGLLFFEINENYGKQTVELLADKGFKNIELRKDMSGKDRMIGSQISQINLINAD